MQQTSNVAVSRMSGQDSFAGSIKLGMSTTGRGKTARMKWSGGGPVRSVQAACREARSTMQQLSASALQGNVNLKPVAKHVVLKGPACHQVHLAMTWLCTSTSLSTKHN